MTSTAPVPPDILAAIAADAAEQVAARSVKLPPDGVEVAADQVEVLSAESVQWNDGSMGCPEPGRSYTQALVDGYRVIVRMGDLELDYRVNGRGRFRICRQGGDPPARSFR